MLNAITCADSVRKNSEFLNQNGEAYRLNRSERSDHDQPKGEAALGSNARTPASPVSRGLQAIDVSAEGCTCIDSETGEVIELKRLKEGSLIQTKTHQETRAERWALKSVVNQLFPISKTAKCSRMRIPHDSVKVLKDPKHGKAHYSGLVRCGSVWWCPLCASKIAERRRVELVNATAAARSMGLQILLMTCTVPHGLGDDVNQVLSQMRKAWRYLIDNRAGKDMRKLLGIKGHIRSLEVTYGQNGFHPHFHILIFADLSFTDSSFQTGFYPIWRDACVKAGLPAPSEKHGLRVDDGSYAEKYVTKWGLEDEMTKGHLKTSKGEKGMTPWDMLRDVLKTASESSKRLFCVYAHAFKGQRQLYWSNGLRQLLGLIVEMTDEELANQQEETAVELAELTPEQWRAVLFTRSEAALLDLAEREPSQIQPFLAGIVATASHTVKPGVMRGDSHKHSQLESIPINTPHTKKPGFDVGSVSNTSG